jgi:dTDP-4-dehydrorhamnose reductase
MNTLKAGGSPKVFEDRTISPSYLMDVSSATRRLIEAGAPAGLYHCVNSGQCTWLEFAREIATLMGIEPRLTPIRMADAGLRARRPQYCALSNEKLRGAGIAMPTWQDALRRFLQ